MVMTLFPESMKGKLATPISSITSPVKKMPKDSQGKTEFIYVAQAFTSQIYNQYKTKNLTNMISAGSYRESACCP